ncbi:MULTISPECIES: ribonuclease toxin immunity protein CdiI [Paenibacillus]|uniref:ribonuclease toxin immunity protein CdiI n=2 Tax=Paenibacillus TaxID=44249 RepID=UPI00031AA06E|nr:MULTISPECIES: ribonuclease toxin immunity protein CdiI [Paenibacillus]MCV9948661.1 ribonuclease toxin immunity protein CdiI [Paenibacillus sp. BT-177]MDN4086211.1 ribonuclease toxin immunity protein CdiI [Paenibacillus polymyxa]MDN4108097.1 ribonuclease toxin immunity protein CdiI [Paenibacillus polymyxa]
MMNTVYNDKNKLILMYEEKGFEKGSVIDVLGDFVLEHDIVKVLEGFLNEYIERRDYMGVIYSDEYDVGDEGYFGENRVLFYYGVDDNYDIVSYKELYDYLQVACNFYIEKNSDKKDEINEYLLRIKSKYGIEE